MKKILLGLLMGLMFTATTVYAASYFSSQQLAPTPLSGRLLQTNGATNTWATLLAGTNITITTSTPGQITFAATGGGSGCSASGTAGSIQFSDGAGGCNADQSKFVWDNINKRLTIGASSGSYPLNINGSNQVGVFNTCTDSTFCGIVLDTSTTTADSYIQLNVNGTRKIFFGANNVTPFYVSNSSVNGAYLAVTSATDVKVAGHDSVGGTSSDNGTLILGNTPAYNTSLHFNSAGNTTTYLDNSYDSTGSLFGIRMRTAGTPVNAITVLGSGRVGIFQVSPSTPFDVVGASTLEGAVVNTTGGYYFSPTSGTFLGANAGGASYLGISQVTFAGNSGWAIGHSATQMGTVTADFSVFENGTAGVNTTTPGSQFVVQGAGTRNPFLVASSTGASLFTVLANGNVGVGSTTPSQLLSVGNNFTVDSFGRLVASPTVTGNTVLINRVGDGTGNNYWGFGTSNSAANDQLIIGNSGSTFSGGIANWIGASNSFVYYPTTFRIGTGIGSAPTMTFNSSNNVGIGTTSPRTRLEISAPTASYSGELGNLMISNSSNVNQKLILGYDTTVGANGSGYIQSVQSGTAVTPLLLQAEGGNVGIGTTSPSQLLTVGNNNQFTVDSSGNITGHNFTVSGTSQIGVTNKITLTPDIGASGERLAGEEVSGSGSSGLFLLGGDGTAGGTVMMGYFDGTQYRSAVQVANTSSGFGTLSLMKSGGNVGIGTSSPVASLAIQGQPFTVPFKVVASATGSQDALTIIGANGGTALAVDANSNTYSTNCFTVGDTTTCNNGQMYVVNGTPARPVLRIAGCCGQTADYFQVSTSTAGTAGAVFDIKASGAVGIGTITPTAILQVAGSASTTLPLILASSSTGATLFSVSVTGTIQQKNQLSCTLGLTTDASGNINGCVVSDQRLKKNIIDLSFDPKVLNEVTPVTYYWKDPSKKDSQQHAGFVAQQVKPFLPQAVVSAGGGFLGIDPNAMISYIWKFLQYLSKEFTDFKTSQAKENQKLQQQIDKQNKSILILQQEIIELRKGK